MVTLYTTGCPRCMVLEKKMDEKGVEYEKVTDQDIMIEKGFSAAPIVDVDGTIMQFKDAVDWINNK